MKRSDGIKWTALALVMLLSLAGAAVRDASAIPAATGGGFEGGPPAGYKFTGPALVGTVTIQHTSLSTEFPFGQFWVFDGRCGNNEIRTSPFPTAGIFDITNITSPRDLLILIPPEYTFGIIDFNSNLPVWTVCWGDKAPGGGLLVHVSTGNLTPTSLGISAHATFMPAVP